MLPFSFSHFVQLLDLLGSLGDELVEKDLAGANAVLDLDQLHRHARSNLGQPASQLKQIITMKMKTILVYRLLTPHPALRNSCCLNVKLVFICFSEAPQ